MYGRKERLHQKQVLRQIRQDLELRPKTEFIELKICVYKKHFGMFVLIFSFSDLERFIEQILHSFRNAQDQTVRISNYIQPQHKHIKLFHCLSNIMRGCLTNELFLGKERIFPFKVRQPITGPIINGRPKLLSKVHT